MSLELVTDYPALASDTRYPWMVSVSDDGDEETQEYILLPDDVHESDEYPASVPEAVPDPNDSNTQAPVEVSVAPPLDEHDQRLAASHRLNSLSTVYTTTRWNLTLPDPGDHRPWYHLDWSSPASLLADQHLLTIEQRTYLRLLDKRVKDFSRSFARTAAAEDEYRTMAAMVTMACDHRDLPFKDRLLRCRTIRRFTRSGDVSYKGKCDVRRFCPYCNYLFREKALLTYVPSHDRGHWYAMTISTTSDLDLEEDELTHSWEAGKAVVKALLEAGHFDGAYWTEEVSLKSLYPEIRVLPHCHVLFHAHHEADLERATALANTTFRGYFTAQTRATRERGYPDALTSLKPSIKANELRQVEDLLKWCDYLTKTVRFGRASDDSLGDQLGGGATASHSVVEAYKNALDIVGEKERWQVNVQFEQFLCGMEMMLELDTPPRRTPDEGTTKRRWVPRRRQRHTLGTLLCGNSERFVGVRPKDRPKHRAALARLRGEIRVQRRAVESDADPDHEAMQ